MRGPARRGVRPSGVCVALLLIMCVCVVVIIEEASRRGVDRLRCLPSTQPASRTAKSIKGDRKQRMRH